MALLAGIGYGLWMIASPLLPDVIAAEATESRNQIGDVHLKNGEWLNALSVYNEILEDDPDNGYVIWKIALSWQNQLWEKWGELAKFREANPGAEFSEQILADESHLFEQATKFWAQLLDNARYRQRAYERLAIFHSLRSQRINAPKEIDKAIAVLEEMLENGCITSKGVREIEALIPVSGHKRFSNVYFEEKRLRALRRN